MIGLSPPRRARNRLLEVSLLTAASFLIMGSCGLFNAKARFGQELSKVDRAIEAGDSDSALKKISSLRKKAITASQWLSLAKRERSLSAWADSVETLSIARFKMPANDVILAVLIDSLSHDGKREEAIQLSDALKNTGYAIQGAVLRLESPESERDPQWWKIAGDFTQDSAFTRNAAVWYAVSGNLPAACAAAAESFSGSDERDRLLLGLLYYDSGFPEQAIQLITEGKSTEPPVSYSRSELELLSDASSEAGKGDSAKRSWLDFIAAYPEASPVAWYNLAVIADSDAQANEYLNELLDRFPSYFPAVSRFVLHYLNAVPEPEKDSLTRDLQARGFYSLSMKEDERKARPARRAVTERIHAAITSTAAAPDIRFFIEEARVAEHDTPDASITASRLWNLLERYSSNDLLIRYAMWFFLRTGQSETAFSLNRERTGTTDPFYDALEAASKGELDTAEVYFNRCAASKEDSWAALANIGTIRERAGDLAGAVEYFDRATSFAPTAASASDLQLDAALVLSRAKETRRAQLVLMRALELDPQNERASAALRRLRGF